MLLASCGTKTTPTTTQTTTSITTTTTKPVTTSTTAPVTKPVTTTTTASTGKWWDSLGTPQYGGTINFAYTSDIGANGFDPVNAGSILNGFTTESLLMDNWTLPRTTWDFKMLYTPIQYSSGLLAESWERPDPQTLVFHIRKGIHFQNKAPANGRELTAADVQYCYNRHYGLGDGFTKPSTYYTGYAAISQLQSITATDKYTFVIKFKAANPSVSMLEQAMGTSLPMFIYPPEIITTSGPIRTWRDVVGSGTFTLTDYVSGSSATLTKNPDYWGFDERYRKTSFLT